jgi:protein-S-isoprenylcysteine O-methyltransferase Ste14
LTPPVATHVRLGAIVGSFVFFWLAPGIVAGWIPYLLTGWRPQPPLFGLTAGRLLGGVVAAGGLVCVIECFARFALKGRGTPAPVAPTEDLVVSGLYRHVRNPMYVAVVALVVGQALILGSPDLLIYAGVIWLLFHLFVLVYEEPTLERQFGASYQVYRANVPRWWPRARPWADE